MSFELYIFFFGKKFSLMNLIIIDQKEVPIEKLNSLVLSASFLSIGTAYIRDIGPIAVKISKEIPADDLISNLLSVV